MSGITRVRNLVIARSTAALLLGIAAVVVIILGPPVPSAQAATNTVVSLTFDDGQASQYSTLPMLSSRGMRGTYYINSALVGSSSYYMPWSQIHDLYNAGNEIGGHTLHHADLTRVSSTEAQREVCDDRTALIGQGFSAVTSFAYPYAAVDNTAEQIVQNCGYTSGRGVGGISSGNVCGDCPYAETIPPGNPNNLQTPEAADSSTTLSQLQSYVTNAESHGGGWVVLVFHGICSNSCTGSNSFSPTIFTAFLDWLQPRSANGTVVQRPAVLRLVQNNTGHRHAVGHRRRVRRRHDRLHHGRDRPSYKSDHDDVRESIPHRGNHNGPLLLDGHGGQRRVDSRPAGCH